MSLATSSAICLRVVGNPGGQRKLAASAPTFAAYAELDERINPDDEAYLSAFSYTDEMREHVGRVGSVRGYRGACGGDFAWVDIDNPDLSVALEHAKRLALYVTKSLDADPSSTLLFMSGGKGFHLGVPLHWMPAPSERFPLHVRKFVERLAADAGSTIDSSIYDPVRLFRAPNSRHPRTGLFKRNFPLEGFERMGINYIRKLAESPEAFEVPLIGSASCPKLEEMWNAARPAQLVSIDRRTYVSNNTTRGNLDRETVSFLREGAVEGERANRLFKASANASELASVHGAKGLAFAMLSEAARESGLSQCEVQHQFESGWKRGARAEGTT